LFLAITGPTGLRIAHAARLDRVTDRPLLEVQPGPPTVWRRAAGDNSQVHLFVQDEAAWWRTALCGRGPAIGSHQSDSELDICPECHHASEPSARESVGP
jgi:hypothetical protein